MIQALEDKSIAGICEKMENVLETVTVPEYPVIDEIKQLMLECGADGALMSGSGPTVFGIFTDKKSAKLAKEKVVESGLAKQIFLTTPYNCKEITNDK